MPNKIFTVNGVGTSINPVETYNNAGANGAGIKLNDGDKILLLNGSNTFDFGTLGGDGPSAKEKHS